MTVEVGMVVRLTGKNDWWSVTWHCPDHAMCGYQRIFNTEAKAEALERRLMADGCPASAWFHDEDRYQHRTENRDAS
jgi:hypothetical protein